MIGPGIGIEHTAICDQRTPEFQTFREPLVADKFQLSHAVIIESSALLEHHTGGIDGIGSETVNAVCLVSDRLGGCLKGIPGPGGVFRIGKNVFSIRKGNTLGLHQRLIVNNDVAGAGEVGVQHKLSVIERILEHALILRLKLFIGENSSQIKCPCLVQRDRRNAYRRNNGVIASQNSGLEFLVEGAGFALIFHRNGDILSRVFLFLLCIESISQRLDADTHGRSLRVGNPHGDVHRLLVLCGQDFPVFIGINVLVQPFRQGGLGFCLLRGANRFAGGGCTCGGGCGFCVRGGGCAGCQRKHHCQRQDHCDQSVAFHVRFFLSFLYFNFSVAYHCCFYLAAGEDIHK